MILLLHFYSLKTGDTSDIRAKRSHFQSKQLDCDEAVSAKKIKKSVTFSVSYSYSVIRNTEALFLNNNYFIRFIIFFHKHKFRKMTTR